MNYKVQHTGTEAFPSVAQLYQSTVLGCSRAWTCLVSERGVVFVKKNSGL